MRHGRINRITFSTGEAYGWRNVIGALLDRLVGEPLNTAEVAMDSDEKAQMKTELEIAAEDSAFQKGSMKLGELTPFTCPECHGILVRIAERKMSRFRCHSKA